MYLLKRMEVWLFFVVPAVLALMQPGAVSLFSFLKTVCEIIVLSALVIPVHEFGHFAVGAYYAKKNKYSVGLEMCYKCTKCDNWAAYREDELIFILQAGVQATLLFDTYFSILAALSGQELVAFAFFVLMLTNVEFNCTVGSERDTDYYYLRYPDKLVSEEVSGYPIKNVVYVVYVVFLFLFLNVLVLSYSL